MASPIQTVIGKGTVNPLIAEGLLKILCGLGPTLSSESRISSVGLNLHLVNRIKLRLHFKDHVPLEAAFCQ